MPNFAVINVLDNLRRCRDLGILSSHGEQHPAEGSARNDLEATTGAVTVRDAIESQSKISTAIQCRQSPSSRLSTKKGTRSKVWMQFGLHIRYSTFAARG